MKKIFGFIFLGLLSCGLTWAQRLPEFEKAREIKRLEINHNLRTIDSSLKKIKETFYDTRPANITNLILSFPEITVSCDSVNNICSSSIKTIAVLAIAANDNNDVITFSFKVSGGKIVDKGKTEEYGLSRSRFRYGKKVFWISSFRFGRKVVWDLSNLKPGTYTITAAVDDGCGFCGKSMTKTIVIKECPDCPKD